VAERGLVLRVYRIQHLRHVRVHVPFPYQVIWEGQLEKCVIARLQGTDDGLERQIMKLKIEVERR